jgi:hypothetical protein
VLSVLERFLSSSSLYEVKRGEESAKEEDEVEDAAFLPTFSLLCFMCRLYEIRDLVATLPNASHHPRPRCRSSLLLHSPLRRCRSGNVSLSR